MPASIYVELAQRAEARLPLGAPDARGPFFSRLTPAICNKIWAYLLVTPNLGSPTILNRERTKDRSRGGLGLSPVILRACREIYFKTFPVLYMYNTFSFDILRDKMGYSEILRGHYEDCRFPHVFDNSIVPTFSHIKCWKVTISPRAYERCEGPTVSFSSFCQAIASSNIKYLKVVVVRPDRYEKNKKLSLTCLGRALKSLELFRNLTHLEIEGVEPVITLQYLLSRGVDWPGKPDVTKQSFVVPYVNGYRLKWLTEGHTAVFDVFKAKDKLMAYAKGFERNEELKAAMEPTFHAALMSVETEWLWQDRGIQGQFLTYAVERGLANAIVAAGRYKVKDFRKARASVIRCLEPQYQRMTDIALKVAKCIKSLKVAVVKFGAGQTALECVCVAAIVLFREYVQSLVRDLPDHIKAYIKDHLEFKHVYYTLPRQEVLDKIDEAKEHIDTIDDLDKYLKIVVDTLYEMDGQYHQIRHARLTLFEYDPKDPRCDIDLELCRDYEEFDPIIQKPCLLLCEPAYSMRQWWF